MNYDKYMTLDELKVRLRIKDDEEDAYLEITLHDVIDHVLTYTNNKFRKGFPNDVKRAVAQLVSLQIQIDEGVLVSSGNWGGGEQSQTGGEREVKSVKIDGLSKTYATSGESASDKAGGWEKFLNLPNSPYNILKHYRIARMTTLARKCGR